MLPYTITFCKAQSIPGWVKRVPGVAQFNPHTLQQAVYLGDLNRAKITTYKTREKYQQELHYMRLWTAGTRGSVWEVSPSPTGTTHTKSTDTPVSSSKQ